MPSSDQMPSARDWNIKMDSGDVQDEEVKKNIQMKAVLIKLTD